ncbi:MAG TPA: ABC transporter permease [Candidatus Limnocylindrales bacterium]
MSAATGARPPFSAARLARSAWSVVALPLVSILLSFVVGAAIILVSQLLVPNQRFDWALPITAYHALITGAFGSFDGLVATLVATAPLIFGGLSVALGFKAGLFNIGAQGQFLVGALGSVYIGVIISGAPSVVAIPLAVLAAIAAGALWGFIPGILKAWSGAHEVVTTIMLNYVAVAFLAAAVSGPLKVPGSPAPVTYDVGNAAFPVFLGRTGHLGILLALVFVALIWWLLYRTTWGFEIRTVGANPDAARYAGMHPRVVTVFTMTGCGVLAGLAGSSVLLGVTHTMTSSFGTTVGFDSISVALLARSNPIGIIFAAILFGAMRAGAPLMQIQAQIPVELVDVLQATILLFLVASPVLRRLFRLRGVQSGLGSTETIARTYGGEATVR